MAGLPGVTPVPSAPAFAGRADGLDFSVHLISFPFKQKKEPVLSRALYLIIGRRLTLPGVTPVPSARVVLTSLFGMGRGGPHRNCHLKA